MPTFTFELPDGRKARLEAPDGDTAYRAFRQAMGTPDRTGPDVESGDEARAKAAGDTRSKMRLQDIEYGYDTARRRGDVPERKAMAEAYVKRENADSPIMTGVGDAVRQFAKGVPVLGGLTDEANAAASVLFGGDYEKSLDYQRARDSVYEKANPWTSAGLQLGGGVASGIGLAGQVAPALGAMARPLVMGTGVGGGAALGAADAYTRGEDGAGERARGMVPGAVIGGIAGGLAPVIGKGIQAGVNGLSDMLAQRQALSGLGLSKPSAAILNRAIESDRGARANVRAAGPEGMLADSGPNAAAYLDAAQQKSGTAATIARDAIDNRVSGSSAALTDALDTSFGKPAGVKTSETAIRTGTAGARSGAYDKAYSTPIDYARPEAREVEDLLGRVSQKAIDRANELMRTEGVKSKQIMATIADDGTVTYKTMPDVRQLDYITRGLRDMAAETDRAGKLAGQTDLGRAIGNLGKKIRDRVRALVPEYGNALDTAADAIGRREALRTGEKVLSPTVARDVVADDLRGMSKAEMTELKQGLRSKMAETLANVKRTITDPNVEARQGMQAIKDLSSEAVRDKMGMILGDKEAQVFFAKVDQAAKAFELRAAVTQNSKTNARGFIDKTVSEASEPGILGAFADSPKAGAKSVWQAVTGGGPERQLAREDKIYEEITRALTEKRGADAIKLLNDLRRVQSIQGQNQKFATSLGTLGAGLGASGLYQAGRQYNTK
jgi:hypothetical protein